MLDLKLRDRIQKESEKAFYNNNYKGSIFLGVGGGKSVIAINIHQQKDYKKVLLVGDREHLVYENWKKEYLIHSGSNFLYNNTVTPICYKSLYKYNPNDFDFIILDECDKLSYNNMITFVERIPDDKPRLALTGTPPSTYGKKGHIFYSKFPEIYRFLIDKSAGKITNDFEIVLHQNTLSEKPYYKSFGKNQWQTNEFKEYKSLTSKIDNYMPGESKWDLKTLRLWRKKFLNEIESKLKLAKYIDKTFLTEGRCLIFTPNVKTANEFENSYHYKNKSLNNLEKFASGEINKLACVDTINRGNSLNVDKGLLMRLDSKSAEAIQKLGRLLRTDKTATLHVIYTKDTIEEQYLIEFLEDVGRPELIPEYLC